MTANRKNSSAPPPMSCTLVGGCSPVGRGAGPMTTMPALLVDGSAWSSFCMASSSEVRRLSSAVRACTLSTVCPGSASLASSLMRRLVSFTCLRRASAPVAAAEPVLPPETRAANVTNCRATWSESCCARCGVSAVPEILMMFPSEVLALTRSRRSVPLTPLQSRAVAALSTTVELVATSTWVSSSRSSHCPGNRTDADAMYRGGNSTEAP